MQAIYLAAVEILCKETIAEEVLTQRGVLTQLQQCFKLLKKYMFVWDCTVNTSDMCHYTLSNVVCRQKRIE